MAAPVLPAETNPSAFPSVTNLLPILSELLFFRRTDAATGSSIPITSAASRLADQYHYDAEIARGGQCSVNLCMWRVVAAHRIENDLPF
jgi:hypothetical protein